MIKTWQQRCEEHPDYEGIVTEQMIRERMQEEIDELRQALAQPEQEPNKRSIAEDVGRLLNAGKGFYDDGTPIEPKEIQMKIEGVGDGAVVCTEVHLPRPPKREWVGLTADEIWKCNKAETGSAVEFHICSAHQNVLDFAEAIEQQLKEKNT
jgi:hypothetical protein